jgi:hypothetical protein
MRCSSERFCGFRPDMSHSCRRALDFPARRRPRSQGALVSFRPVVETSVCRLPGLNRQGAMVRFPDRPCSFIPIGMLSAERSMVLLRRDCHGATRSIPTSSRAARTIPPAPARPHRLIRRPGNGEHKPGSTTLRSIRSTRSNRSNRRFARIGQRSRLSAVASEAPARSMVTSALR